MEPHTSTGRVGLGCMGLSWVYDPPGRDSAAVDTIRQALDLGVALLDTADLYGPFDNERVVGRAVRGRRPEVTIATKAGLAVRDGTIVRDGSPQHLRESCEGSLTRLGVDHVDVLYLHRIDDDVPLADSWAAMAELVTEGKVRGLGLSEVSVAQIAEAGAVHPVAAVQSELSLWSREPLADVLPYCREQGIPFVAACPLGRGYLAGRVTEPDDLAPDDGRRMFPRYSAEALAANRPILDELESVATAAGVSPAQVALAWVLAQPGVTAIPGSSSISHVRDNLAAERVVLSPAARGRLDSLPAPVGSRY